MVVSVGQGRGRRPAQAEYAAYLRTPHWAAMRAAALAYAERRCQLCYSSEAVEVHHRTYERVGHERPADLTVLCAKCHERHHGRHDKRRMTFARVKTP